MHKQHLTSAPLVPITGYAIIALLLVYNVYRAHFQSITHDEALTYNWFVSQGAFHVWNTFHSNNHVLNSLLMWATTSVAGISHLSIRLSALVGGFIFLLFSERLVRQYSSSYFTYMLTLLLVTTNPFVLDFMVAARGYGLAVGFFMASVYIAYKIVLEHSPKIPYIRLVFLSLSCALSTASQISFASANAAVIALLFSYLYRANRNNLNIVNILVTILPGLILFLLLYPSFIFGNTLNTIDFSTANSTSGWLAFLTGLSDVTFQSSDLTGKLIPPYILSSLWVLPIILAVLVASALLTHQRRKDKKTVGTSTFFLFLTIFIILIQTLAHYLLGVPFPLERTGLYFIPVVTLLFCTSLLPGLSSPPTYISYSIGKWLLAMIAIFYLLSWHPGYFYNWKYDSSSLTVYNKLLAMQDYRKYQGIGIDWLYEPSLNYYRLTNGQNRLPPFSRQALSTRNSIFVLDSNRQNYKSLPDKHQLHIYYKDSLSGATIYTR